MSVIQLPSTFTFSQPGPISASNLLPRMVYNERVNFNIFDASECDAKSLHSTLSLKVSPGKPECMTFNYKDHQFAYTLIAARNEKDEFEHNNKKYQFYYYEDIETCEKEIAVGLT
eukprot:Pgem_evm1s10859